MRAVESAKRFNPGIGGASGGDDPLPGITLNHTVILGDSNAYGNGDTDNLDDQTLKAVYASVSVNQVLGAGDPFVAEYTIATRSLQPFAAGGVPGCGVELALGRALYVAGRTNTKLSVWASRGSALDRWIPSAANYYPLVTTYLDARVAEFGNIGVVYLDMGTNDSVTTALAGAWATNAALLIDALRARYGNFTCIVRQTGPNLDALYPYAATVRGHQVAFCHGNDNNVLLNADDIPLASDNLHYSANRYSEIGYRVSSEVVRKLGPQPVAYVSGLPQFVGAVGGVSGAGALSPNAYPIPEVPSYFDILVVASGLLVETVATILADPAGFVYIGRQVSTTGGLFQYLYLWYRRADRRYRGAPTTTDANQYNAAKIFTFRQPTTMVGSPLDIAAIFSKNDTYDTPISITGGTSLTANCLIALFTASYGGSLRSVSGWANTDLGAVTEIQDNDFAIGSEHEIITLVTGTKVVAGAFGATTAVATAQLLGSYAALVIKP